MEETLPAVKQEKIAELFAIRAGLSVISENTDKIKERENEVADINKSLSDFFENNSFEQNKLSKDYNNKIEAIEKDIELLAEDKYPIKSIENGEKAFYYLKEDIKEQREKNSPQKPKGGAGVALFFLLLFVAGVLIGFFGGQELETVWIPCSLIGFWGFVVLKIVNGFNGDDRFTASRFREMILQKRYYKRWLKKCRDEDAMIARYEEIYNKEAPLIIKRKRQELSALKNEKESELKKKREQIERETATTNAKAEAEIQRINDEITALLSASCQISKALSDNYPWFSESDWENTDLVIYYLQTGRADTIKEALYQVDRQRQTEQIVSVISQATQYLVGTINNNFYSLEKLVKSSFQKLAVLVENSGRSISRAIEENSAIIKEQAINARTIGKLQEKLLTETQLSNSLLAKANETSDELLNDLRYQQRYWA